MRRVRVGSATVRGQLFAGVLVALVLATSLGFNLSHPGQTAAATSDNINFQARLEGSNGAIANDGDYNVQFKLYNASTGGTALWTESYLNSASQGVRVVNGYLTVNLGSITAFPSTIPWDQDMYVTMNIGGTTTGSPTYDGEMTPRLKLTAVPYAFQAKSATQLQASNGGNVATLSFVTPTSTNSILIPDASGTVCLETSVSCGFAAASGSSAYIQNGTSLQGNANLNIQTTATGSITAVIQALTGQTADLLRFKNAAGTAALSGFNSNGQLYYQSGSFTGTLVQDTLGQSSTYHLPDPGGASDTVCLLSLANCTGTGGGIAGSGTQNYIAKFDTVGGNHIGDASIFDNGSFVGINTTTNNGLLNVVSANASQSGAFIQSAASSTTPTLLLKGGATPSTGGNLLDFQDSTGALLATVTSDGSVYTGGTSVIGATSVPAGITGQLTVVAAGGANVGAVVRAGASQTGDLLEFQDSSGLINGSVNATGNQLTLGRIAGSGAVARGKLVLSDGTTDNFGLTLQAGTLSANSVITIPDSGGTDTVCLLTLANCTGTGGGIAGSGTQNYIAKFDTLGGNHLGDASLYDNGSFVGLNTTTNNGLLSIQGSGAGQSALFVKAAASATTPVAILRGGATPASGGDLLQLQTSGGSIVASFDAGGNFVTNGSATVGTGLTVTGGATITGGTNINTTGTANTNIGNSGGTFGLTSTALNVTTSGALSGITGYSQASGNFLQSGTGTFGTGTGAVSLNGGTTVTGSNTFTVGTGVASFGGNVGIGTASPNFPLDIQHTGYFAAHFQTTSSSGQTSFYLENDRGSFASYGGFLYGSSASSLPSLFGVPRSDRLFMFSDGASNLGYYVGTLNAQPFVIGTNNVQRLTVDSSGKVGIGATPANGLLTVGTNTTAASDGVYFGTDTDLYRSAADTLKTDDSLIVGTNLSVTGTGTYTGLGTFNGGITDTGNFSQTGSGTFSTGTGTVTLNGATSISGTNTLTVGTGATTLGGTLGVTGLTTLSGGASVASGLTVTSGGASITGNSSVTGTLGVSALGTFNGGLTIATGSTFTNASSTLFSSVAIANHASNSTIGSAATTVDVATTFDVTQTTGSIALTLPNPTTATSGRVVYVNSLSGNATFTMYGVSIPASSSAAFIWNGTTWVATSTGGSSVNTVGTIDSQTKSANGAVISGSSIYLQTADATSVGLVSTGTQTFAGAKTFSGAVTVQGAGSFTGAGTGLSVTNDASIGGTLTANALSVTTTATIGTGLTVTSGGATITAGDLALTAGNLTTGGTQRLSNAGALSNITGYAQSSGNFLQSGAGTFGTGTGAVSLNGNTSVTGSNTFSVGTGATTLGGTLGVTGTSTFTGLGTFNGGITDTGNFSQTGSGTFSTGTGTVTLNGATSISGTNTLTVGTGATTLGGTLGVTGLSTLSGGATISGTTSITGATTINTTGTANTSIGNATGTFGLASNALNISTAGALSGISGYAQASGNFAISGSGTFSTGTGTVTLNGATSISGTNTLTVGTGATTLGGTLGVTGLTTLSGGASVASGLTVTSGGASITGNSSVTGTLGVSALGTFNGGLTIATGSTFTNASSTLFSSVAIANHASNSTIGSAATTVDVATTFDVTQTTGSIALTLPNPTTATSGRVVYVNSLSGNATFTMYGVSIPASSSAAFIWNGTTWVATSTGGSSVNTVGTIDSQTKSANGAVISGSSIYLQTADATSVGLVSTGTQTFAGAKTFSGAVTVQGAGSFTGAGTGLSVTNDASIGGTLTANALSVTTTATIGTGLTVTSGGATITAGDLALTAGNLTTGGTQRLSNAGALSNITGYAQSSGNFLQSGAGTFGTGTGAVSLNGNTSVTGSNTFSVGTGATTLGGTLGVTGTSTFTGLGTFNGGITDTGNFSQTGSGTFSTGTGTVTLNGATSISGTNTLTVGTGATTLGGTLGVTGLSTLSGGATISGTTSITGATTINTTGTANTSIGNATGTFGLASNALNISTAGALSGISGYAQASGNFAISGSGTFSTGTGTVTLNGATSISGTNTLTVGTGATTLGGTLGVTGLTTLSGGASVASGLTVTSGGASITGNSSVTGTLGVSALGTFNGGLTIATGSTFTNASSTLFSSVAIANHASNSTIGSAATTVDVATTFDVTQTTGSIALTLPNPTTATSGRVVYVNSLSGNATFTMYGVSIPASSSAAFIWNGTTWVATSTGGSSVNTVGTIDSQTKSANGAVISGSSIYLQTADATSVGLVSTGTQTFAGAKTFSGAVTVQGAGSFTGAGTGLSVTNDASIGGTLTANALSVTTTATIGTGLTVTSGGATITAGDLALTAGNLTTGGTQRLSNAGALSNITGYAQSSGNFLQSGAGTFGTGTGAVSLNGNTSVTGSNTFSVGTGATTLGGTLGVTGTSTFTGLGTFNGGITDTGNFSQTGSGTFSTGTGTVTLNGATSISGTNTLTVGTGATTLGGTLGVTGLSTLSGGATISGTTSITGATTINTTGTANTSIGNATGTFGLASNALNISTAGALSGVTGITTSGAYTQSGTSANTFTGASTFSASGTALTVSNNAAINGTGTIGTLNVTNGATVGNVLTVSNGGASILNASTTLGVGSYIGTDSTHGLTIGYYNANNYAIWSGGVTPSSTNYGILFSRDGTSVQYNSTDNIEFNISDNTKAKLNSAGLLGIGISPVSSNGYLQLPSGTSLATGGIGFGTDTDLYRSAADTLKTDDALVVAGAATLQSTVGITGNTTIGGTLNVTGVTTLAAALNANGGIVTNNTNINAGTGTITSGLINGQTISGTANFTGTLSVNGASLTIGTPGTTIGSLNLSTSASNSRQVILQGLNPSGTGNATIQIPSIAGGTTDTVCLLTVANCGGGTIGGSGTANYVARFSSATALAIGQLYDTGTAVSVGGTSPSALFNVGSSNQFQVSSAGAVTAVGVNSGAGLIQGTGGLTLTGGNFSQTGSGTFSTGTGTVTLNGATSISGTNTLTVGTGATTLGGTLGVTGLTTLSGGASVASGLTVTSGGASITGNSSVTGTLGVSALGTFNGGLTVGNSSAFINSGSSTFSSISIADHSSGGNIGTAAATVDVATTFDVTQTTASQTLTLPTPTVTPRSGHIAYINSLAGNADFVMYGVTISASSSIGFIYNGTTWVATSTGGTGINSIGTIDTPTKSANGAHITGSTLYLQNADSSNVGLVSTGAQDFAGVKNFLGNLTVATNKFTVNATNGNTLVAGTLGVGTGLTVTSGGATITAGDLALTAGNLTTGGTQRLSNSGALSNITDYAQSSGNFLQSGSGTFGTGSGAVSLNGNTSVTGSNTFAVGTGQATFGGSVGIGATTPGAKLHIKSAGGVNSGILLEVTSAGSYSTIDFQTPSGLSGQFVSTGASFTNGLIGGDQTVLANELTNGALQLGALGTNGYVTLFSGGLTAANERLRVTAAGNVGIGDTTPASLFTVGNGDLFQVNSSGAIVASTGIANSGGYVQSGTTANTLTGATSFTASGTALSVTNNASIGGTGTIGTLSVTGTSTHTGLGTFNGGLTVGNSSAFINSGSSTFSSISIADHSSGGNIGTAAATVDVATTFDVTQTTASQTLTLPTPTVTPRSGHIAYINSLAGNADFVMYGVTISASSSIGFIYNGTTWVATSTGGTGINSIGTIDTPTKSANGAHITGSTLYLQNADSSNVGLVSTGAQDFAGVKNFLGNLTVATNKFTVNATNGNTLVAGTLDVTGNFNVNTNKLQVTASTGDTLIAGTLAVNGSSITTTGTGTASLFNTNALGLNIGGAATAVSIGAGTGTTTINNNLSVAGTAHVVGNFDINTNKFTVNGTSGNTLVAGTLDSTGNFNVNTNKFQVTASNGNTVIAGTSTHAGLGTFNGGLTVGNSSAFINSGSSTFSSISIADHSSGGNIGTAAATVDVATTFDVTQTTASQTLTLPTPTVTPRSGHIAYINSLAGNADFVMYGVTISASSSIGFIYNGTTWVATSTGGTGINSIGTIDTPTKSANGAHITGSTLYLQNADSSNVGLVSTGAQDFAGVKNFLGNLTVATNKFTVNATNGNTLVAGTLDVTGNFNVNTNKLQVTASTGDTLIAGTLAVNGSSITTTGTGTASLFNTNALGLNIGGAATAVSIGAGTGTTTINNNLSVAGTAHVVGNFDINTNKFTVNGTSGNTLVAGTLDSTGNFNVNTNKFQVTASNGNTVIAGTSTHAGLGTFNGGLTVGNSSAFINSGSSTFSSISIADHSSGGNIGTAAATVDVATTFDVTQTTASQTLTLPTPTVTPRSGHIAYINSLAGNADFVMYGVTISASSSIGFIYNGTTWVATSTGGTGINSIGTIDTPTKSANGAHITGSTLYLQNADSSNVGLVSTGAQDFAGVKNFLGNLTVATNKFTVNATNGNTLVAGTLDVTGNFNVNTNKLQVTASTGDTLIAGTLAVNGSSITTTGTGTASLFNTNALGLNIGGAATAVSIGAGTGTTTINNNLSVAGTAHVVGNFDINTNKFTVNGTSGNTLVAGTLDSTGNFNVNTNKFQVTASNGNTVIAGTSTHAGLGTFNGGLTVGNSSAFINSGSSTFSSISIADHSSGGNIGTAAATVDVATTFDVTQTTASQTLTLPTPTVTPRSGHIAYINSLAGNADFVMYGVTISASSSIGFIYNGTTWVATSTGGTGINSIGTIDTPTKSANGAHITGSTLYLQNADSSNVGLVSTGAQDFAGVKNFLGNLTVATNKFTVNATNGNTLVAGTLDVTGNFNVNTNKLQVTASTGDTLIAGTLAVNGSSITTTGTGTASLFNTNALGLNIGGAATAVSIGAGTGTTTINNNLSVAGTAHVVGNFDINTNKFTVNGTSGNTLVAGTLDSTGNFNVNTNKFQVTASNGNTVIAGTSTHAGLGTFNGGLTVGNSSAFINSGSSTFSSISIADHSSGGNIGTAAATVDVATTFDVTQTTASQTLTLPTPTVTPRSGHIAYINSLAGNADFVMYGVTISASSSIGFIYNGTTWVATSTGGTGINSIGTIDTPTKSANGAHITGSTLYLQNADSSNVGLVSTGAQDFAGVKNFLGNLTVATNKFTVNATNGNTLVAGTLDVTGNFNVNTNKLQVTASTGDTLIAGTLAVNGSSITTTGTGTASLFNTNALGLNIGGAATAVSIGAGTGTTTINNNLSVAGTAHVVGNFDINTNKFTVNGTSGNTLVAGTLDSTGNFNVNTNKFQVTASNGNTLVAGTLGVAAKLTLTGTGANEFAATGTPAANGTSSLIQFGGAIANGIAAGTYLGINAPAASTYDFVHFENNNAVQFSVGSTGTVSVLGNAGVTTNCSGGGQILSGAVYTGGIVTGGTCSSPSGFATLQNAYDNSAATDPQIQLSNAYGGVKIRDASGSTITKLLEVANSTGATDYFAVTATGISTSGVLTVSGTGNSTISGVLRVGSANQFQVDASGNTQTIGTFKVGTSQQFQVDASGNTQTTGSLTAGPDANHQLFVSTSGVVTDTYKNSSSSTGATFATTNQNSGASSITVNSVGINLTGNANGTTNANTINGINFGTVTTLANNTFNGLVFGGGYDNILSLGATPLINGAGKLQDAAINSALTYTNLQKVGALNAGSITTGFGTISTGNNITTTAALQGNTLAIGNASTFDKFTVDASGNTAITGSGTLSVGASSQFQVNTAGILTLSGSNTNKLNVSGTPTNSSSVSLVTIGATLNGGNTSANGGTYLSITEPSSGSGSAADFINFVNGTTSQLQVSSAGALTANGAIFGSTLASGSTISAGTTVNATSAYKIAGGFGTSGQFLRSNGTTGFVASVLQASDGAGIFIQQAPSSTANNTIQATGTGIVGLSIKGPAAGGSDHILDIYNNGGSPTIQAFFDNTGSLNVTQAIQATANNTVDLGTSTNNFRTGYFGTSVVTTLIAPPSAASAIQIGSAAQTGIITLGLSTDSNTINIGGGATANTKTQAINIGAGTPAGSGKATITIGNTNGASGITLQGGTAGITIGSGAGQGFLTNNGSLINTTLAKTDFATNSSIGTAATTVDIYTSISIAQTTTGVTLSLPAPTANTAFGRLLYISNVGTASFILNGATISAGTTATLVWSNTNITPSWQYAGADANGILNQNTADQSANFRITGTGQANTSFTSPLFDSVSGALGIGTGAATAITIGSTANTAAITLQGTNGSAISVGNNVTTGTLLLGGSAQSGNITLGSSSAAASVLIANGAGAPTVNIANTSVNGVTLNIAGAANTSANSINIANGATAAATTVSILSGVGTAGASSLLLGNNTRVTQIDIGNIAAAAARTINVGTGANTVGVDTLNIGTGNTTVAGGKTIHIGDGTPSGAGTNLITIGATANASTTTIQGGTGTATGDLVLQTAASGIINIGANAVTGKVLNLGSVGSTANASIIHIADTTGNALQGITIGASAAGGATAANNTLVLEAGSTATGIQIGNSAQAHGIQIGTGAAVQTLVIGSTNTTSTTAIQGGTTGGINIGSVGASTLSSTTNIANTSNATGTQSIFIGSTANAANNTNIRGGSTGGINIGQTGSSVGASFVNIANTSDATGTQNISIGSPSNAGSSLTLRAGTTGGINVGQVGASTIGSTIHVADTTDATGAQAVTIGSKAANAGNITTIQGGTGSTAVNITTGAAGGINIASVGSSTVSSTVHIADTTSTTSAQVVTIGSSAANTSNITTIQGGTATGAITLLANGGSNTGIIAKTTNASTAAFQIQTAAGADVMFTANSSTNVLKVGNSTGTNASVTLFQFDNATAAPTTGYLGSMFFDTVADTFKCYNSSGWNACGASPNISVNLIPEYVGAVLNGTGVGTLTSNICSGTSKLSLNTGVCASTEDYNYYQWTSPQGTSQTYNIYVRYQLPATFKNFASDTTISLTARTSNTTNGSVAYTMYKPDGTLCGTATTVTTSANTWQTVSLNGTETTCSLAANDIVMFKIAVSANSNANVYVGNLSFLTLGQ